MDMGREVGKAFFYGIKTRKGAEHREVRRPDMGGNKLCFRACLQGELQQVPAVQPKDGPAVRMNIANGFQPGRELVCGLQAGQQNDIVHLAGLSATLINRAYLTRHHKARGGPRRRSGQAQFFFQPVETLRATQGG